MKSTPFETGIKMNLKKNTMEHMFCPSCRTPLEEAGLERLETIEEHVCNPNGIPCMKMAYRCPDAYCITRRTNIVWNEFGDRYGGNNWDTGVHVEDKDFIDGNDAPFGTLSRKLNVEIYKKGLPKKRDLFTIGNVKFVQEFQYRSDDNGKVLKKWFKILKLKGSDDDGWLLYEFPIIGFINSVNRGIERGRKIKKRKAELEASGKKFKMSGMDNVSFSLGKWDKRWWRVWSVKVNRFLFPTLAKEVPLYH